MTKTKATAATGNWPVCPVAVYPGNRAEKCAVNIACSCMANGAAKRASPAGADNRHDRASYAANAETQARMTLGLDVRASVVDRLLNGGDLLGFLIRDFHAEFVFEGHHEFNGVERGGAKVVHERRFVLDLSFC